MDFMDGVHAVEVVGGLLVAAGLFKGVTWSWSKGREIDFFLLLRKEYLWIDANTPSGEVLSLDLEYKNGGTFVIPLVMGKRVPLDVGVTTEGIYHDKDKTSYLLQSSKTWSVKLHKHDEVEHVTVIAGTMIDTTDPDQHYIYAKGETWEIPAGEYHSVLFQAPEVGFAMVIVDTHPPLLTTEERPLQLDHMAMLKG